MQHSHPFVSSPAQQSGTVAVIGLGKIGLPLAIQYVQHGRRVIGCDINPQVVEAINAGRNHVHEEPELEDLVASAVAQGQLSATTDTAAAVRQAAVVVVIVPVIVDQAHGMDFRSIDAATHAVGAGLTPGTLVIYETTLPTGTTAGRLRMILEEQSGLKAGSDFLLAYSPERVSSGHIFRDLATYPKVVGGINEASRDSAHTFYRSVLDAEIICMTNTDEAEFVKLIETTYRDVNIALANEFAHYADTHGLDVIAAIAAANTQPYSHIHAPGVGVGGHCIPVYPYFLLHGATEGLTLPRQARLINDEMARYTAERIESEIGSLAGQAVLILGVAYRGDVREVAFTSAKLLREALLERDARVFAEDPLFSDQELEALDYQPLRPEHRGEIRAIIVQAAHQTYQSLDFSQYTNCRVVLDGRRALRPEAITAAGMRYLSIGDGKKPLVAVR
jgi:nucleotide sugar dehydrogenase